MCSNNESRSLSRNTTMFQMTLLPFFWLVFPSKKIIHVYLLEKFKLGLTRAITTKLNEISSKDKNKDKFNQRKVSPTGTSRDNKKDIT